MVPAKVRASVDPQVWRDGCAHSLGPLRRRKPSKTKRSAPAGDTDSYKLTDVADYGFPAFANVCDVVVTCDE